MRRLSVVLAALALTACVPELPEVPDLPEAEEPALEEPLLDDAPVNADHPDVFATLRIMDGDTAVREVGNFYADPDETYFFLELPAPTEISGIQGGAPKVSETKWITIGTEDEALDLSVTTRTFPCLKAKCFICFLILTGFSTRVIQAGPATPRGLMRSPGTHLLAKGTF